MPTHSAFQSHTLLAWEDVSVDSVQKIKILKFHLKVSKRDQFGNGIDIFLGHIKSPMCPVSAALSYMAIRGPAPGPSFHFQDGTPLTKSRFVMAVRDVLGQMDLDQSLYAGHPDSETKNCSTHSLYWQTSMTYHSPSLFVYLHIKDRFNWFNGHKGGSMGY